MHYPKQVFHDPVPKPPIEESQIFSKKQLEYIKNLQKKLNPLHKGDGDYSTCVVCKRVYRKIKQLQKESIIKAKYNKLGKLSEAIGEGGGVLVGILKDIAEVLEDHERRLIKTEGKQPVDK